MKPSQVVSKLRQIAAAIENSKNPDKRLVARDLKKLISTVNIKISTLAESGDPNTNGFKFSMNVILVTPTERRVKVNGTAYGVTFSGTVVHHMKGDEWDGWDYEPDPNTENVSQNEEVWTTLLDATWDEVSIH